jgi:hypothetical protein
LSRRRPTVGHLDPSFLGLMGETCREENVRLFLSTLDELMEGRF